MTTNYRFLLSAFTLIWLFSSCLLAEKSALTADSLKEIQNKKYTLTQITALSDINLTGINPTFKFYLPIGTDQKVDSITLHLIMSPSPLLNKNSTLTLMANDMPVNTSKLEADNGGMLRWDVQLPTELLVPGIITLNIVGQLEISDNICFDLYNPGNWLKISGSSVVEYNEIFLNKLPTLEHFPYPFLQKQSFDADHIIFSWPDSPSLQNVAYLLPIMSDFTRHTTWRGLEFSVVKQSNLADPTREQPIVMVGTLEQLQLKNSGIKLPLRLVNNTQITNLFDEVIDENTGVIMVTRSPWNEKQSILILTGKTTEAVNKTINELSNLLSGQTKSTNDFLLVANKPSITPKLPARTFKDSGYTNQVVYGLGLHHITYTLFIDKYIPTRVDLDINFGHATNLPTLEQSYLTLKANNIPVGSIYLDPKDTGYSSWVLSIPPQLLKIGNNTLDFVYDLNASRKYCEWSNLQFLWGSILNDSKINIQYSNEMAANQLSDLNELLSNSTVVALPNNPYFYTDEKFIYQLLLFIKNNTRLSNISLIETNQVTYDLLMTNNLLYIGSLDDNEWLKDNITFTKAFYEYPHTSFLTLTNSPTNTAKILIVSTNKTAFYSELLKSLNTPSINKDMVGDVVLFDDKENKFIALKAIKKSFISSISDELDYHWIKYCIIGLIICLFGASLALLLTKR